MKTTTTTVYLFLLLAFLFACLISSARTVVRTAPSTQFHDDNRSFFVSTVSGLEAILEKEIKQLPGVRDIVRGKTGVSFSGDSSTGLAAVLWLRSALRVLEVIGYSDNGVETKDNLYDFSYSLNWGQYLEPQSTFKCDTIFGEIGPEFNHNHFTSLTMKNALVDWFRTKSGVRPSVDTNDPDVSLLLYLHRGSATIYRAWSGEGSMHKRGYREIVHRAALRESTAAALLLASGWGVGGTGMQRGEGVEADQRVKRRPTIKKVEKEVVSEQETDEETRPRQPQDDVGQGAAVSMLKSTSVPTSKDSDSRLVMVDPFCGSGTLLIEAALIYADCAPGLIKYCGRNQYNDNDNDRIILDRDRGNQNDYDDGSHPHMLPRLLTWPDLQDLQTSIDEGGKGQTTTKATNIRSLWAVVLEDAMRRDRRAQLLQGECQGRPCPMFLGNDVSADAIYLAQTGAANAGVAGLTTFTTGDISALGAVNAAAGASARHSFPSLITPSSSSASPLPSTASPPPTVVTNPPWDLRLEDGEQAWVKLDKYLRDAAPPHTTAFVLSGNPDLLRHISIKPSGNLAFSSSNMPMRLVKYVT